MIGRPQARSALPRMTAWERFVAVFSPRHAQRRIYRRETAERPLRHTERLGYEGAGAEAHHRHWSYGSTDADTELDAETRETLRDKARDLIRNEGYAAGLQGHIVSNVVGAAGLIPQSRVKADEVDPRRGRMITEEAATRARADIEAFWRRFAASAAPDGKSFDQVLRLVQRSLVSDGEVFVHRVQLPKTADRPFVTAVEVIEADRITTPPEHAGKVSVVDGIEKDKDGRIVEYYVTAGLGHKSVPASEMCHHYVQLRPGQTRGQTVLAPLINLFRDLYDYVNATIVQQEVAACLCAIIESESDATAVLGGATESDEEGNAAITREQLRPRAIIRVPPGNKVHIANPQGPSAQFDAFVELFLRKVSTTGGVPYEVLAADFSKTNYSSARAAFEEARRSYRIGQADLTTDTIVPIWGWVWDEAVLARWVDAPGYAGRRYDWRRMRVVPPGWQHIDRAKEAAADRLALGNKTETLTEILARRGIDFEEHLEQIKSEVAACNAIGVIHPSDPRASAKPAGAPSGVPQPRQALGLPGDNGDDLALEVIRNAIRE